MEQKTSDNKKERNQKKAPVKWKNIRNLILGIFLLLLLNWLSGFYFQRIDLTAEKRYTLTDATKEMLENIDDFIYFRVYLEGDFPAGFKRLQNQTREMLDEFSAYSGFVEFEFINPTESGDWEATEQNYQMLINKGLQPTQIQVQQEDASSQQVIFPGLIASNNNGEVAVSLLEDQMGAPSENVLNNSAQALEFKLASAIHQLTVSQKPTIGFTTGNGELDERYTISIRQKLSDFYTIKNVDLKENKRLSDSLETLIIAKPQQEFSEADKYHIDQFVMNGGKILWLVDPVFASMDSLQMQPETIGMAWPLNLDDMLFKYGARLNPNLITDMQSVPIPITTGYMGNRPQISLVPWFFFPLANSASDHPVVKNLNPSKTEFVSSIDTVGNPDIKKTILLESSPYSKVLSTPTVISFEIMEQQPDESFYRDGPQPIGVLLEGRFESLFKNRIAPPGVSAPATGKKDISPDTRMIVISDGDIIRNQFDNQGNPLPLGFDRFLNQQFGNEDLILNAVGYLSNNQGLMESRNREIRIRQLDRNRVNDDEILIQFINLALPVLILFIFGVIRFYIRKKRYNKKIK